jgi:predicted membrane protein
MKRLIILSAAVIAISLLYFFLDARVGDIFPHCPFHTLTGFYCPGCGSQRALSSLLHADFLQAINFNTLLVISLPFLIYAAIVAVVSAFKKQRVKQKIFYSPLFVKTVLVVVVAFWILRNIPRYPFTLLAPH